MKKLYLLLLLTILSVQSFAGSCPDGSDPIKSISDDGTYFVYKCGGGTSNNSNSSNETSSSTSSTNKKSRNGKTLNKSSTIITYDVEFSEAVLKELLEKIVAKTEFDFSSHNIANNSGNISCVFKLRRVNYDESVEGRIENWNIANGSLSIQDGKVSIDSGSSWRMGGLSSDPNYLQNEVNVRVTKDGHFVGKMAYFVLNVEPGSVAIKPSYPKLRKNPKSKPLSLNSPENAELWIDFDDPDEQWQGGVLYLSNCKNKS